MTVMSRMAAVARAQSANYSLATHQVALSVEGGRGDFNRQMRKANSAFAHLEDTLERMVTLKSRGVFISHQDGTDMDKIAEVVDRQPHRSYKYRGPQGMVLSKRGLRRR